MNRKFYEKSLNYFILVGTNLSHTSRRQDWNEILYPQEWENSTLQFRYVELYSITKPENKILQAFIPAWNEPNEFLFTLGLF